MAFSKSGPIWLDALGLGLAGLINTFLAPLVASVVLGPGSEAFQPDALLRMQWIADHALRWRGGWFFWFAVTLSFAWSYFALGRHLHSSPPWRSLAIGLALIAAAVDLVGVLINMTVIPELAGALNAAAYPSGALIPLFSAMEGLAYALINVAAFGLYSLAGLLLLPAAFATIGFPRWLAWLGVAEWSVAAIATLFLILVPAIATVPLLISFGLYAPWVWGGAWWLSQQQKHAEYLMCDF